MAPPYNSIKFNEDIAWSRGKASIAMLAYNAKGQVLGLKCDNYECTSTIVAKFLAIQKALFVFHNFMGCDILIESDFKVVMKALLDISTCL